MPRLLLGLVCTMEGNEGGDQGREEDNEQERECACS